MKWIIDNWSLIVVILATSGYFVYSGKASVKKWLLNAVIIAEKELGSQMGRVKLAQVYSDFVATYPVFSKIIPFAVFSLWVDIVLEEMRHLIETNDKIAFYIEGDK